MTRRLGLIIWYSPGYEVPFSVVENLEELKLTITRPK